MAGLRARSGSRFALMARLVAAAGLVVDAALHLQLAPAYQLAAPAGIGQGNLFRVEAVLAILAAAAVLVRPGRRTVTLALGVSASALAAVLVYRYVDVPSIGPIPSMYEPVWFAKKSATAVAEFAATASAAAALVLSKNSVSRTRQSDT
jgi:hypothetical protein